MKNTASTKLTKSTFSKVAVLCAVGSAALLSGCGLIATDDTDIDYSKRSGMVLVVDAETGCQYLSRGRSITSRLTENNKLFCGSATTAEYLKGSDRGLVSVDYGTGCEYISTFTGGGLTPRLNKEGEQSCKPELKRTASARPR